jgi:hypothetical protein
LHPLDDKLNFTGLFHPDSSRPALPGRTGI